MTEQMKGKLIAWALIAGMLGGIWGLDKLDDPPEVAHREPGVSDYMPTKEDCYNHPDELAGFGC